jgi:hypothetical protein
MGAIDRVPVEFHLQTYHAKPMSVKAFGGLRL